MAEDPHRDRSATTAAGGRRHTRGPALTVVMDQVGFGESLRWRDQTLWFCDWHNHHVIALDPRRGTHRVVATVESVPMSIDFLPDGRPAIWRMRDRGG